MNKNRNLIRELNNLLKNEPCIADGIEVKAYLSLELIGKIVLLHSMERNGQDEFDEEGLEKAILDLRCQYPKFIDAEIDYIVLGLVHWYFLYSGSGAIMKQELFLQKVLINRSMSKFQS